MVEVRMLNSPGPGLCEQVARTGCCYPSSQQYLTNGGPHSPGILMTPDTAV